MARTLVADDQPDVLRALGLLFKSEGYEIETVTSPAAVLAALQEREFDVLLMDLNYARDTTSGQEGLDLVSRIQALDNTLPIIVMTAWGTVEVAVEALHRGALEFVQKPWDNAHLLEVLRKQLERGQAVRSDKRLEAARLRAQERELQDAREIQRALLPKEIPQVRGCQLVAGWRPVSVVGGDYFDVFRLSERRVALCIADVVGKGMPAALLMSNLQAAVKAFAGEAVAPDELCTRVNGVICTNIASGRFITFFYAIYDPATRHLEYTCAGHNPPLLLRADGSLERLCDGGIVLGVFPDARYDRGACALAEGDRLVLFTDGLTEATSASGEEFGEERLIQLVSTCGELDPASVPGRVLDTVARFAGELQDDATLVVLVGRPVARSEGPPAC